MVDLQEAEDALKSAYLDAVADQFTEESPKEAKVVKVQDQLIKLPNKMMIRAKEKIGRNAPCPCGSGKKYKKCCMEK